MKKLISVLLVSVIAISFCSCSGKSKEIVIDSVALCNEVMEKAKFTQELELIDSNYALTLFGIESMSVTAIVYAGTAASAETISVFQATNESDTARIQSAVESRIDYLSESYASYGPDEVPKIDSATVLVKGNYVIFCISEDNYESKQIIEDFIK